MKKNILLTLAVSLSCTVMAAVLPDMKFRSLDTRDGLSNSQVNCIFKDRSGFVWIGTAYGLNRYDGYRVHSYYSDANDTTSMRSNYVDGIYEDAQGLLWVKQGMNYCVYDPKKERFERDIAARFRKMGIVGGVDRMYVDDRKNFWVKTYDEGLYYYNPKTKKLKLFPYGYDKNEFPSDFWISSFATTDEGVIVASSKGNLICYDGERGKELWRDDYCRTHGGVENVDYIVKVDADNNFAVVTRGTTFFHNRKTGHWCRSLAELLAERGIVGVPEGVIIWDVFRDERDWLWVATDHLGLFVIDLKNRQVRQFVHDRYDDTTLPEMTLRRLYQDPEGKIWISSYKSGLCLYTERMSNFKTISLGDVTTMTEDAAGNYWVGTNDNGVIKYDPRTGDYVTFNKSTAPIASNAIMTSLTSRDGSLWFGTYNGGLLHYANGAWVNYLATGDTTRLLNNNVWSLAEDRWGNIWLGTLGSGIQKLDPRTGRFRNFTTKNTTLQSSYMASMSWTKKGWLLVGHSNFYALLNPANGKLINRVIPVVPGQGEAMAAAVDVVEDSRGLLWYGSASGCCVIDQKSGKRWMIDMKAGLYGSSVMAIEEDLRHTMWLVTEHGLSSVVPERQDNGEWMFTIRSYNSHDGTQEGPFNQRAIYCTRDGQLLVGGVNGLDIISPQLDTDERKKQVPVFSGLVLFGEEIKAGEPYEGRVILDEALNSCRRIVLRHDENQFTIQLGSTSGEIRNHARFIYKLEGFSDKWIRTDRANPNITYMSLPSGTYTLCVRMLNDDGTMGAEESRLEITVLPPFYRAWWAVVFYMLLAAVFVWWWRRNFIRHQEERLNLERVRRETEKKQWMNDMRTTMAAAPVAEAVDVVAEEPETEEQDPASVMIFENVDLVDFSTTFWISYKHKVSRSRRIVLRTEVRTLPVQIDTTLFGQALTILLDNAIKFSPKDSPVMIVLGQNEQNAVVRIIDQGVGIPEEARRTMFDAMVGNDELIGLDTVKEIVTILHGEVRAEDNPEGGTIFLIELPLI